MNFRDLTRPISLAVLTLLCLIIPPVFGEGSRSLYPASYPAAGSRANLDLQPGQRYMDRVLRRGFNYVYAEAGEYIVLGSSNIGFGGDIQVYNPQDFGIPGDETLPASIDFTCSGGTSEPGTHFAGAGLGAIASRGEELAGPNSADNTISAGASSWQPCAYQAPTTGIYGVQFTTGSGGGPNGNVSNVNRSSNSVAGWEIVVRDSAASVADLEGRVFTYAFLGFTGGNNRPIFSTLYYVTRDGYRYQQDLRGLDPNGYALYANTFGFLDDNEPLYKTLRSNNAQVSNLPLGVSAQPAQFPIFFSDVSPGTPSATEAERALTALGIPLAPPSPQISNVAFSGALGDGTTATGAGGSFSFSTSDTVSYEIVISRDGIDFDAANPLNRVLTGIAFSGLHTVDWDGLDNSQLPFPASAQPYAYKAFGRNGEVHFPIIDAENNGIDGSATVPGGGPTITRLNGASPGDTTVFFDDRGYVTRSGETVGVLNGFLCGDATPAAADPAVNLAGVDSSTLYRRWENGRNRNSDCANDAGWGDAKGVNLWTYFLTPEVEEQLIIVESQVDVATSVTVVDTAEPGDTVQGVFSFANNGTSSASNVSYQMTLSPGLAGVSFGNLPGGASASYDAGSGVVTLTGFPGTLAAGESFSGMTFSYSAPASGPVLVDTQIATSDDDDVPGNNSAQGSTGIGAVDVATEITGVPTTADPGSTVTGSVLFSNVGTQDAGSVSYSLTIGDAGNTPTDLVFTSLPAGVNAIFDTSTGVVTLTGMPDRLAAGLVLALEFSYTAPAIEGASYEVTSGITTGDGDANPANNDDQALTVFDFPPEAALFIDSEAVCIQDVPYIRYEVTPLNFTPQNFATIEFIGSDNNVVETLTNQPLSGQLLWPGAAVDVNGVGIAWPGWELQSGVWVQVPSVVRPQMTVRISVNPTSEVVLGYPPATPACASEPPPARPVAESRNTTRPGGAVSTPTAHPVPAGHWSSWILLAIALGLIVRRQLTTREAP